MIEEYTDDLLIDNTNEATKLRQAEYREKLKRRENERKTNRDSSCQTSSQEKKIFRGLAQHVQKNRLDKYQPLKQVYTQSENFEEKKKQGVITATERVISPTTAP